MLLTTSTLVLLAVIATGALLIRLIEPSRGCRTCGGLGLIRGERGRWARFCDRCNGSGQVDSMATRALVAATRGRVLPRSGTVARGRQHGQGYRFAGRSAGGRWIAAADPDDTRLAALVGRRIPACEHRVERREAAHDAARGLRRIGTAARLAMARRALRKAEDAAERHRAALESNSAGYRRAARR
jgi:hypothetical protein